MLNKNKRIITILETPNTGIEEAVLESIIELMLNYNGLIIAYIHNNASATVENLKENIKNVNELENSKSVINFYSINSNFEGIVADYIIVNDANCINDSLYKNKIIPIGVHTNAKIVKIGSYKKNNDFYHFTSDIEMHPVISNNCLQSEYVDKKMINGYPEELLKIMPKDILSLFFEDDFTIDGEKIDFYEFQTKYLLKRRL